MTAKAGAEIAVVIDAYDFSGLGTIADIGAAVDTCCAPFSIPRRTLTAFSSSCPK